MTSNKEIAEGEHNPPRTVGKGEVILKTSGLLSAFSGEGFPTVLAAGTRMTKEEAEIAFAAADQSPDTNIEEVTKL